MSHFNVSAARAISLAESSRRALFSGQPLATDFRFFDACDGRDPDVISKFDTSLFEKHWGSSPTPGQLGCTVSHFTIIRAFALEDGRLDDWMLVAEDDVVFRPETDEVVNSVLTSPPARDIVVYSDNWSRHERSDLHRQLGAESRLSLGARRVKTTTTRYRIGRFSGAPWSAAFYSISRQGAREYVQFVAAQPSHRPWRLADDWAFILANAGIDIAVCRPSLVEFTGGSTTRTEESISKDLTPGHYTPSMFARAKTALALRSRARGIALTIEATGKDLARRLPSK